MNIKKHTQKTPLFSFVLMIQNIYSMVGFVTEQPYLVFHFLVLTYSLLNSLLFPHSVLMSPSMAHPPQNTNSHSMPPDWLTSQLEKVT